MGQMDIGPKIRSLRSIVDRTNAAIEDRPLLARTITVAPVFALFGIVGLVFTTDAASAQWCSMPVLARYTGISGSVLRGIPIFVGAGVIVFGVVYFGGGNYFGMLIALVIGLVAIGIGFGLPSLVTWAAGDGQTLAAMDMQCMFDGGAGGNSSG